jgi:DNA-binding SARP family transcriptional activator
MPNLSLILLGGFEAILPSGARAPISGKKAQALLAYCAIRRGSHLRTTLATLLWGNSNDERARNSLRQTLHVLRSALRGGPSGVLRIEADTVATDLLALEVDVQAFEELAAAGTPHALERAAALYRGDLLEGLDVGDEGFEEWLRAERDRLRELAIEVLAKLFRHQCAGGAVEAATQTARRLLALDPLQEIAHRALMRLLVQAGRREAALRQYEVCCSLLKRELHLEPDRETRRLYEDISSGRLPRPASVPSTIGEVAAIGARAPGIAAGRENGWSLGAARAIAPPPPGWGERYAHIVARARAERARARWLVDQINEIRADLTRSSRTTPGDGRAASA